MTLEEKERQRMLADQRRRELETRQQEAMKVAIERRVKKVSVIKKKPFWWLGIFQEKMLLVKENAELKTVLADYQDHATKQSSALKGLYKWALAHETDNSLDEFKKILGPLDLSQGQVGGTNAYNHR